MNYFVWDTDPVLFAFKGLEIRWYGLMFALAFLSGFHVMKWMYTRDGKPLHDLDRMMTYIFFGMLIGARLGHCLFYDPAYYLANPMKIPAVWEGGLASHGGGLGVLISLYWYRKKVTGSYLGLLDSLAIPTAGAGCFIRTGNFFNSEIIGVPTTVPWAVIFKRIDPLPRHPAQMYEALAYLLICILLFACYLFYKGPEKQGRLFGMFLVLTFTARISIEFVKENQAAFSMGYGLHMGQLLSLPFILAGIILIVRTVMHRPCLK